MISGCGCRCGSDGEGVSFERVDWIVGVALVVVVVVVVAVEVSVRSGYIG